jgi:hypothetical protein
VTVELDGSGCVGTVCASDTVHSMPFMMTAICMNFSSLKIEISLHVSQAFFLEVDAVMSKPYGITWE